MLSSQNINICKEAEDLLISIIAALLNYRCIVMAKLPADDRVTSHKNRAPDGSMRSAGITGSTNQDLHTIMKLAVNKRKRG